MSQTTSSNNIRTNKRTFVLHFERYVQESAYAEVEAGSLAEAAEIARNMTWDDVDGLDFHVDEVVDDAIRLYSIASEDDKERISVSNVEDDRSKVLSIEACSLIDDQYGDRIQHASDIGLAGNGNSEALARLQGVVASLSCKTTEDFVRLFRIVRCIRGAGGTPSPIHASSWMAHIGTLGRLRAARGGDLPNELQGKEELIAWMGSVAEVAALSARIPIDGTSARQSANL